MKYIWKREWQYREREWNPVLWAAAVPFIPALFLLCFPQAAEQCLQDFRTLPAEAQSLLGLQGQLATGTLRFCLQWLYMPFGIMVISRECLALSDSILDEEASGRIFFLLNRRCSRYEFILGKFTYYAVETALCLLSYLLLAGIFILPGERSAGSLSGVTRAGSFPAEAAGMWAASLLTGSFWLLVVLLYTVLVRREQCRVQVGKWMGLMLLAGNLWRIRDLLILLLRRQNRSYAAFYRMTGWLKGLQGLSPLYSVNPFTDASAVSLLLYSGLCLMLCAGLLVLCLLGFRLRNITESHFAPFV